MENLVHLDLWGLKDQLDCKVTVVTYQWPIIGQTALGSLGLEHKLVIMLSLIAWLSLDSSS